ncbi:TlpA disulfide reductase family protein [Paraburkholderia sp. UYCP14C]|uniref:TlpA family protein disulfide reductase n=1 Tax=Paraburkholderia sp. UYCP14C TaxID=2511130 RepID=UPI001459FDEE|nr:TlpA disulfide reductase family protein [Paraburkholderia sp. UYCP14C]
MTAAPIAMLARSLILFASVAVALVVARIVNGGVSHADRPIIRITIIALVLSRLAFVAEYLPAYRADWISVFDIRDLGFAPRPGIVAGVALLSWVLVRRSHLRRAMALAAVAGLASWGAASAAVDTPTTTQTIPRIALANLHGNVNALEKGNGKPQVVNLWASWCGPCRAEMPVFEEAQKRYSGLNIVLVNQGESSVAISDFLTAQGLNDDNVMTDPNFALARAVRASVFPTTLFYDAQGNLLTMHAGAFSRATLQHALEALYPDRVAAP